MNYQVIVYDKFGPLYCEKEFTDISSAKLFAKHFSKLNNNLYAVENLIMPFQVLAYKNGKKYQFNFKLFTKEG